MKHAFDREIVNLEDIKPNEDLISIQDFKTSLKVRADEREKSILRGISIEALLVNRNGMEHLDGYSRYTVLNRYK